MAVITEVVGNPRNYLLEYNAVDTVTVDWGLYALSNNTPLQSGTSVPNQDALAVIIPLTIHTVGTYFLNTTLRDVNGEILGTPRLRIEIIDNLNVAQIAGTEYDNSIERVYAFAYEDTSNDEDNATRRFIRSLYNMNLRTYLSKGWYFNTIRTELENNAGVNYIPLPNNVLSFRPVSGENRYSFRNDPSDGAVKLWDSLSNTFEIEGTIETYLIYAPNFEVIPIEFVKAVEWETIYHYMLKRRKGGDPAILRERNRIRSSWRTTEFRNSQNNRVGLIPYSFLFYDSGYYFYLYS